MKKSIVRRKAADTTRQAILQAARSLFLKLGYTGVSMQMIADKAEVNQNLIFHHFDSKSVLWQKVKESIVANLENSADVVDLELSGNLKEVLKTIIESRFNLYDKNPDFIRLMQWQRLENSQKKLQGGSRYSPENWVIIFKKLQERKLMRQDVDAELVTIMLANAISGALMDQHKILADKSKKQEYVKLLLEIFLNYLHKP